MRVEPAFRGPFLPTFDAGGWAGQLAAIEDTGTIQL